MERDEAKRPQTKPPPAAKDQRVAREAAKLRENLRRRKEQARAREAPAPAEKS